MRKDKGLSDRSRFLSLPEDGFLGIGVQLNPEYEYRNNYDGSEVGLFNDTYLRFPNRSFVLFGPNGIGKSRFLQAIKESLEDEGECTHETVLFYAKESNRQPEYREVLENRQNQYFGSPPMPLEEDVIEGLIADGNICKRRSPGSRPPMVAVGVSQDSASPAVRDAVSELLATIRKPLDDPEHFVEILTEILNWSSDHQAADVTPLYNYLRSRGADPDEVHGPITDEHLRWLGSPEGLAALREWTWDDYCFFLELSQPNMFFEFEEPFTTNWPNFGRFNEAQRPAWAPWPLEWTPGDTERSFGWPSARPLDVDNLSIEPVELLKGLEIHWFEPHGLHLARLASDLLRRLLLNAPSISLVFDDSTSWDPEVDFHERQWLIGAAPSWRIQDPYSGLYRNPESFSPTQQRWIALAINLALRIQDPNGDYPGGSLVVICDEPELGLPPEGQRHLSRGLSSIAKEYGVTFILASHSASILADSSFDLIRVGRKQPQDLEHIRKSHSRVSVTPIDQGERSRLTKVGVPPSEMLYLFQTVLLVEGLHDLWVLDELVGPELEELRVKVLPVHGAKQAAALFASEAGLLFEHIPGAKFVVAVDGTKQELLEAMLSEAQGEASEAERLAALGEIVSNGEASDEAKVMHALLRKAIETDRIGDVGGLFGFRERDIIEYLDPAAFGLDLTWPELREKHQERLENKKGTPRDFKKWLELSFNASFDEVTIRSAVPQDSIPEEVLTLLDLCRAVDEPTEMEDES